MTRPYDPPPELEAFLGKLHKSSSLLSYGIAHVEGRDIPAVEISNLYGQKTVWGLFSVERGKFKGKLANNANTEGVTYSPMRGPCVKLEVTDEGVDYCYPNHSSSIGVS